MIAGMKCGTNITKVGDKKSLDFFGYGAIVINKWASGAVERHGGLKNLYIRNTVGSNPTLPTKFIK